MMVKVKTKEPFLYKGIHVPGNAKVQVDTEDLAKLVKLGKIETVETGKDPLPGTSKPEKKGSRKRSKKKYY